MVPLELIGAMCWPTVGGDGGIKIKATQPSWGWGLGLAELGISYS